MFALEGYKVLDLTRLAPGPFATMLLGDMGADILRIEEPASAVSGRRTAPTGQPQPTHEEAARALAYSAVARNKRSVALNLKDDRARAIFYQLAAGADVVVEGFRPGVARRLGVDYDALRAINPRLVYGSITGYGQYGPYSQLAGHDINYIAQAGLLALLGGDPDGPPTIPLNYMADLAGGGSQLAFGVVCALLARERTGRGQYVDVSMADGATQIIGTTLAEYFQSGDLPRRGRHRFGGSTVHYNVYQCKDGKWISVGSLEPYFYAAFVHAIGRGDWLDQEHAGHERHQEMIAEARVIFRTRDRDEWFALLNRDDQCAMKVLEPDELAADAHIQARGMIVELAHPEFGAVHQVGFTPKLSETPPGFRSFAAAPGQHTDEVLTSLGYTPEHVAELREAGAVG